MAISQLPKEVISASQKSLHRYITGFILSLIFTLTVYAIVQSHLGNGHGVVSTNFLIVVVAALAAAQCIVQVVFFLHLAGEEKPRTRLLAFCFMLLVVTILIVGSLWIMNNLNYHMMTPQAINANATEQEASGGF